MEGVGAALGDHVDVTPEGTAEFGLTAGSDDLNFLNHVQAEEDTAESGGIVIGGETVHDEIVGEVSLAADGKALSGDGRRFGEQLIAGGVGGGDAGDEQCQIQETASIEGQAAYLALCDCAGD